MTLDLRGLWVPLVTPFNADDRVDAAALGRLARRVLADGARGLVALGTTGEPATLDADEQRLVIDVCADACAAAGAPLIIGAGTSSTRATVTAVQALRGVPGLVAVLVVVPYYTRPSPEAIVDHYRVVATESPVPVVAYNIPYRTGRGLDADHLRALAALTGVAGVKQAVGALDADTLAVLGAAPPGFHVLSGDDAFIAPTLLMGGHGAIAAAAHLCTSAFAAMVDAALAGDVLAARRYADALLPVVQAGFAEPSPALWKAALHAAGEVASPALRAPMTAASPTALGYLLDAVATAACSRPSSQSGLPAASR